jgi:acid phosphatase
LIRGNLTLTDSQVSIFPYLCGFESHITGSVSPFCGIFTKKEIQQYEYRQDLRYYYGTGKIFYQMTDLLRDQNDD